jgi:hypothetical protein
MENLLCAIPTLKHWLRLAAPELSVAPKNNYIGKPPALPANSKSLTAPYFETLRNAEKALTNADLFGGDRKRLIGFCPHRSAFKAGVTFQTALSGSNLSSLGFAGGA